MPPLSSSFYSTQHTLNKVPKTQTDKEKAQNLEKWKKEKEMQDLKAYNKFMNGFTTGTTCKNSGSGCYFSQSNFDYGCISKPIVYSSSGITTPH